MLGLALLTGGLVICGLGLSPGLRPAQYEATEKIRINPFDGLGLEPSTTLDPYFLHTTFEIINSEAVLGEVVTNLDLKEAWGKKYNNGKPLSTAAAIKRIQATLRLAPIHNTRLFTISYGSSDPAAAARIARAIADSYQDYRNGFWHTMSKQGLDALQEEYQNEEKQIQAAQTNALDELLEQHRLLYLKIDAAKVDAGTPKNAMVQIMDPAVPPLVPLPRNFGFGASLFVVGGFPTVGGLLLIKSSRQQTT
jgi:uncharacterized protein involved in exopolysaccharide biosynthesis